MIQRRHLLAIGTLSLPDLARAQTASGRPVRIVVPFPAGGGTDILARLLAEEMAPRLGTAVVVENRPGAGGVIGSDAVAKAAPDGTTLVLGTSSSHAIVAGLNPAMPHDVVADFTPVAMIASNAFVLLAHPDLPVRTVAELVAYARARPGQVSYASSGNGTTPHLAAEMFRLATGVDITHVPYRGTPASQPDLLTGRVQIGFDSPLTAVPAVRSGALRGLAVTGAARMAALPEVPTMQEAGVPDYEATGWFAVFGPRGLPAETVARTNAVLNGIIVVPEVRERFAALGLDPMPMTPDALAAFQRAEVRKWGEIIRAGHIRGG